LEPTVTILIASSAFKLTTTTIFDHDKPALVIKPIALTGRRIGQLPY
jgi:hypothetical protein